MSSKRDIIVEEIARRADLPGLAEELGMRVIGRGTRQPKALCPFHDDRTPSLVFYPGSGDSKGQYHCFACGAHGDVYGLVMKLRNCDFRNALEWLSGKLNLPIPHADRRRLVDPRQSGLQLAFDIFKSQSEAEVDRVSQFASQRAFEVELLSRVEVFAAEPPKLSWEAQKRGREAVENLLASGLIRRKVLSAATGASLPTDLPPRDFFLRPRIIFTLRDDRGKLVGFAGRALSPDDEPKYLYSPGFPRGETLYRLDHIRSAIRAHASNKPQRLDIFAVEGLLDALRLESLGLHAVAVFGTQLTLAQARLFSQLASDLDRDGCQLVLHLFFDADEPGRHALRTALPRLLEAGAFGDSTGFLIDVILPKLSEQKSDPDEMLRTCKSQGQALSVIGQNAYSVMEAFLADALSSEPVDVALRSAQLPESYRVGAYREIERRLRPEVWQRVFQRLEPFARHLDSSATETESGLRNEVESFLLSKPLSLQAAPSSPSVSRDDLNQLQRAMQVALASGQRKELPVDEGSWERMDAAVEVSIPFLADRLASGIHNTEPMIATLVPKPPRDFRPKALPCAETLTMQQYLLNEVLKEYSQAPDFSQAIPAIRYASGRNGGRPWMTGGPREQRLVETVSFAYQIDMDVVEGRVAPRREGMFRPYYRCWREFINFIDRRAAACRVPLLHVARLDIRRFYDTIPRSIVIDALLPGLKDAISSLADAGQPGPTAKACAPLFIPSLEDPEVRAQRIVDWLCDESFNFLIENPETGESERQRYGIPQGPDLSAYLANIALFRLDYELQKIVNELDGLAQDEQRGDRRNRQGHFFKGQHGENNKSAVRGGVYARYVDDMVLVARNPHDLSRLRSAVELQLNALGLTLSPKTEPLPAMDVNTFREWLTSERGAALGASGVHEGPPSTDTFGMDDPLVDAGDVERGDSLQILYSPRLEDPITTAAEIIAAIQIARLAHDLRHGDRAKAAQHIWRCVIKPDGTPRPMSATQATEEFVKFWDGTSSQLPSFEKKSDEVDHRRTADLLAWLEGIDRLLGSRRDRDPAYSVNQHQAIAGIRQALARLVCDGLCPALVKLFRADDIAKVNHMLTLRCMALLRSALLVAPNNGAPQWFRDELVNNPPRTAGQKRLIISIALAANETSLLDRAGQQEAREEWLLLHEVTARLQLAGTKRGADETTTAAVNIGPRLDPLAPLSERLQPLQHFQQLMAHGTFFYQALGFLLPDFQGFSPAIAGNGPKAARSVARMLSSVAPEYLQRLLQNRRSLTNAILNSGNANWRGNAIATPPGIEVPGLIGIESAPPPNGQQVVRVDFKNEDTEPLFCPDDLKWQRGVALGDNGLQPYLAGLGNLRLLTPLNEGDPVPPTVLIWLADAFTALACTQRREDAKVCAITAVNIVGRDLNDAVLEKTQWHVLGYEVQESRVRGQAFIRRGNGLMLEPIADWHDHLWRVGTALADFLGRLDVSRSIPSLRITAKANILGVGSDWAVEAMLRFSLTRLRGWSYASSNAIATTEQFPKSIKRLLGRLRSFPIDFDDGDTGKNVRLAHLLATLGEGRALHLRGECGFDFTLPGGAAALLADLVRGQFTGDEELASRLPKHSAPWPEWTPIRRPARAWLGLALRLEALIRDDPHPDDPTLNTIASGARLLSIEAQIRAQSLELWAIMTDAEHEEIRREPIFEGEGSINDALLLHREQETDPLYSGPGLGLRFLLDIVCDATARNAGNGFHLLDGVTPLGWAVLLSCLITAKLRVEPNEALRSARAAIDSIIDDLMLSTDNGQDAPWDDLAPLARKLTEERTSHAFIAANNLDQAIGVVVASCRSQRFSLRSDPRTGMVQIDTDSGSYQFPSWRIDHAGLRGEPHRGVEQKLVGERHEIRWSQSLLAGRLLDIGVVKPYLARLSDLESSDSKGLESGDQAGEELRFTPEATTFHPLSQPNLPSNLTLSGIPELGATPRENKQKPYLESTGDPLAEMRRRQEKAWASRSEKVPRHARVAFFQWNLDETYRHPLFDACLRDFPKPICLNRDKNHLQFPEHWNESGELASCGEHRRQILLKTILRACREFKVDILLLPEYSIRPETVTWLTAHLPELAPDTSVWAGTYRQPPDMRLKVNPGGEQPAAWSAVMPIIVAPTHGEMQWRVQLRTKKYPAVAASEVFNPKMSALVPEFKATSPGFDPRSYIYELICSEAFLVTSPANLLGMVDAVRRLRINFGESTPPNVEEMKAQLLQDISTFAQYTSLSHSEDQPRLLLLVPAMTTRSADYSILGQASFLASAITTVFCNAVEGRSGRGESCVIGHDGWGKDGVETVGFPGHGPYHGPLPGIYHPNHYNSGRLGRKEQALVIVDIDPVYSPEGKPRPQMLPPPLSLVAHLPIIESQDGMPGKSCLCENWKNRNRIETVREFSRQLLAVLGSVAGNTGNDRSPQRLADQLKVLEELVGSTGHTDKEKAGWLEQRRHAYLREHAATPRQWPPPVAVDWLFADLGEDVGEHPKLEMPAYSLAPGEPERKT